LRSDTGINNSATVFHFGIPEDAAKSACGFMYASANDFVSEPLPLGKILLKPEGVVPEPCTLPDDFKKIMESQIELENKKEPSQKVYIGGEVIVCQISRDGFFIEQKGIFSGWDDRFQEMINNLPGNKNT
jgi:hypothetical protein